jgi:AcrR family transcriptional regulator
MAETGPTRQPGARGAGHDDAAAPDAGTGAHTRRGPGRPGGEESRSRILDEAGKLFARDGFDGVTIRHIASRAQVNLAAVGYHFGSKKGLYHEVMCLILADCRPILEPAVAALHRGVAEAAGDRSALAALAAGFVRHTLTSVLMNDRLRWQHALLVREFSQPSDEFSMILTEAVDPMHDAVAQLVGAATGRAPNEPATRLLTTDIVGQCMVYQIARTLVCARMGWEEYTPETVEALIDMVTRAVQRILGLPEIASSPDTPPDAGAAP